MFIRTGNAIHPEAKLQRHTCDGTNARTVREDVGEVAAHLTLSGDSTERPSKAQASLVKMLQISAHWLVSSRLRYGEFSMPWRRYTRLPMRI